MNLMTSLEQGEGDREGNGEDREGGGGEGGGERLWRRRGCKRGVMSSNVSSLPLIWSKKIVCNFESTEAITS